MVCGSNCGVNYPSSTVQLCFSNRVRCSTFPPQLRCKMVQQFVDSDQVSKASGKTSDRRGEVVLEVSEYLDAIRSEPIHIATYVYTEIDLVVTVKS